MLLFVLKVARGICGLFCECLSDSSLAPVCSSRTIGGASGEHGAPASSGLEGAEFSGLRFLRTSLIASSVPLSTGLVFPDEEVEPAPLSGAPTLVSEKVARLPLVIAGDGAGVSSAGVRTGENRIREPRGCSGRTNDAPKQSVAATAPPAQPWQ